MNVATMVEVADARLPNPPFARPGGSLLIMVGLPGTGKSSLVEAMGQSVPFVVITTDEIRQFLPEKPVYTPTEKTFIYDVCHALIGLRLQRGQRVVFDGTNYVSARRKKLYALAKQCGATLAICHVLVSTVVARQRLATRVVGERPKTDRSEADWTVYQWMVEAQEPIQRPHLVVDTTHTPMAQLGQQLQAYWLSCEAEPMGFGDEFDDW